MIEIKGYLSVSVCTLVRLCEFTLSFITALAPIDFLGYFKSDFGLQSLVQSQITIFYYTIVSVFAIGYN